MNRRSFIATTAATTLPVGAGCLADGPPGDDTEDPTDTATDTPDPTPHGPELTDSRLDVTAVECGSDHGYPDVTTGDGTVTVEGVVDGRNGCYTAELVRGEYDRTDDTLYVEVEARDDDSDGVGCTTCLVEIHYTAGFTFDHGTPGRVDVEQRGATTTTGSTTGSERGSASAPDDGTTDSTPSSGTASADDTGTPESVGD